MPVFRIRSFLLGLCLLGTVFPLFVAQAAPPAKKTAIHVGVDRVRALVSDETVPILGRVIALQSGPIAFDIAGMVATIRAEVGDRVKAGAPLITLDPTPLRLKVDIARAEATAAAARHAEANALAKIASSELARLEKLKNSAAFTPSRYEDKYQDVARAKAAAEAAGASHKIAIANRKLAERDLSRTILTAPYDGVVVERRVDIGGYVAKGEAAITMINDHDIEIEAEVPADLTTENTLPGRLIVVALTDDSSLSATIRAVLPRENPRTRTRIVRLSLPADIRPGTLSINRTVSLAFPSGKRQAILSVAKDAVIRRAGQTQVMIATEHGAETRTVTLGRTIGSRFTVVDGLTEGDLAVVRGNERLSPGTLLTFQVPN
ncbi:MAG: efflux RND transporter periplasmic adaptor subunit [Rhodospirillaceae bacterium]|nr:efflux RND transporter periplasmic adaptor subunit [Rhodospirillaceae bacterium]